MSDEIPDDRPREGSKARAFWEYAQAFARGLQNATGVPKTAPTVAGPQSPLVQLLRAHCRDDDGKPLKGSAVLSWIEETVQVWRQGADERTQQFVGGWTPRGFAAWLDAGRPIRSAGRPEVAHIEISRGRPSGASF